MFKYIPLLTEISLLSLHNYCLKHMSLKNQKITFKLETDDAASAPA